jgi:hypothetical protein
MRDRRTYIQPTPNQSGQHERRAMIGLLLLSLSIVIQLLAQKVLTR